MKQDRGWFRRCGGTGEGEDAEEEVETEEESRGGVVLDEGGGCWID